MTTITIVVALLGLGSAALVGSVIMAAMTFTMSRARAVKRAENEEVI